MDDKWGLIVLPSSEYAQRDRVTMTFDAVRNDSFNHVTLRTHENGLLGGINEILMKCFGDRTCQNFTIERANLLPNGVFSMICKGKDSCQNDSMAIDMMGSGDFSLVCEGDGPCQRLEIDLTYFNFADITDLTGQTLVAKCSGKGNVCSELKLVGISLFLQISTLFSFRANMSIGMPTDFCGS